MKKTLFMINKKTGLFMAIFIFLVLIFAYFLINKPLKRLPAVLKSQTASGSLSLSSAQKSVSGGDTAVISIVLDTGGENVLGTDVLIEYDSKKWLVDGIIPDNTNFNTFMPIVSKDNLTFDWQKAVNEEKSLIRFSALGFNLNPNWNGNLSTAVFKGGVSSLAEIKLKAKPVRKNSSEKISIRSQIGETTDSNIFDTNGDDILGSANQISVKIKAEPKCQAAVDQTDNKPGLNDLLRILAKGWNMPCSDCLEDLDESSDIGLGDLMYIVNHWDQECLVVE